MRKLLLSTLLLLLGCTSPTEKKGDAMLPMIEVSDAEEQLRMAMEYDKKGHYEEAAEWYRKAAKQGLSEAQNNLGVMYRDGLGLKADTDSACYWFEQAALKNLPQAQHNLEQLQ